MSASLQDQVFRTNEVWPDCDPALLLAIERHSALGWPAPEVVVLNGWECRFAPGSQSRRVNSLTPLTPQAGLLPQTLAVARRLCRERGVACTVRTTPAIGAEDIAYLEAEGFVRKDTTSVEVAPLAGGYVIDPAVDLAPPPHADWLQAYARTSQLDAAETDVIDRMLSAVGGTMILARLQIDGAPVAFGRAVMIDGLLGIFQIATTPSMRRQGLGRRIVTSLMAWGRKQGGMRAYLQVVATNVPARTLYQGIGFKPLYPYTYYVRDETV
jgi:GNAT superfamily N-acetyltransferase